MKVLLTGSAGFIGSAVGVALETAGHEVVRVGERQHVRPGEREGNDRQQQRRCTGVERLATHPTKRARPGSGVNRYGGGVGPGQWVAGWDGLTPAHAQAHPKQNPRREVAASGSGLRSSGEDDDPSPDGSEEPQRASVADPLPDTAVGRRFT